MPSVQGSLVDRWGYFPEGRAITHAVSRCHHTAVAWVRSQVMSCGICGGRNGTGAGFLRVLRFPLPVLIPPNVPYSSSYTSVPGTTSQLAADVPNGRSLTPRHENYFLKKRRD
jgi:hypothetical protein